MAIPAHQIANFETLQRAVRGGNVCLMECRDRESGELIDAICMVNRGEGGTMTMLPVAVMPRSPEGPLFDRLVPPLEGEPDAG